MGCSEWLEHTAEVRLRPRGATMAEMLAEAGRALARLEVAEEAPFAYKDVERVVDVVHQVGLAGKVARLRPLGVVKGNSR